MHYVIYAISTCMWANWPYGGIALDFAPPDLAEIAPGAWKSDAPLPQRGIKVLGTPFGSEAYVQAFGETIAEKRAKLLHILPKLPSLQIAWLLLYYCGVPRLNHLLRNLPPEKVQPLATAHDNAILQTFRGLLGIPTHDEWTTSTHGIAFDTWVTQATLPLRLGGYGAAELYACCGCCILGQLGGCPTSIGLKISWAWTEVSTPPDCSAHGFPTRTCVPTCSRTRWIILCNTWLDR